MVYRFGMPHSPPVSPDDTYTRKSPALARRCERGTGRPGNWAIGRLGNWERRSCFEFPNGPIAELPSRQRSTQNEADADQRERRPGRGVPGERLPPPDAPPKDGPTDLL